MTMYLPWKKSKIGRVSRFVSDLRSSKHGGSLVVETGFPTSLIDLIVKNRDRLKKPASTKNKKRTNQQQQSDSLEISGNYTPPPPSSSYSSQLLLSSNLLNATTLAVVSSSCPKIKNHPHHCPCKNGEEDERKISHLVLKQKIEEEVTEKVISAPNRTFMFIMKLFFLLILAIGTTKLAIASTMLAFFLLFIEFSCSSVFFFPLKPCPNATKKFNSVVESGVNSVHHHQKDELIVEEKEEQDESRTITERSCRGGSMFESEEENNTVSSSSSSNFSSTAEKEEQGSSNNNNEEIQMIEPGYDSLHCGCRWGFTEKSSKRVKNEDLIHENSDIKNQLRRNSNAKFKSKLLKKFVPKKFRQSKENRNNCDHNNSEDDEEEERNLEGGNSTNDLSNSNSNSQGEAEDDEKSNRGKQQDHNQVEKHKNDDDDESKCLTDRMQTDNHRNN